MIFGAHAYGSNEYGGAEPFVGPQPSIYAVVVYGTFTGTGLGDSNWGRAQWGGARWAYGVVGTSTGGHQVILLDMSGGFIHGDMAGGLRG
jgi:hypothetical protein